MPEVIRFRVPGTPRAKGSMAPFTVHGRKGGRTLINADQRVKLWQAAIRTVARRHAPHPIWKGCPIGLHCIFHLRRPVTVPARKRPLPCVKPDLDKLYRTVGDALTGVIYQDDSQVTTFGRDARKVYDMAWTGVEIRVWPIKA